MKKPFAHRCGAHSEPHAVKRLLTRAEREAVGLSFAKTNALAVCGDCSTPLVYCRFGRYHHDLCGRTG